MALLISEKKKSRFHESFYSSFLFYRVSSVQLKYTLLPQLIPDILISTKKTAGTHLSVHNAAYAANLTRWF